MEKVKLGRILTELVKMREEEVALLKEESFNECIVKYDLTRLYLNWCDAMCQLETLKGFGFKFESLRVNFTKKNGKTFKIEPNNLNYDKFLDYAWIKLQGKEDSPARAFMMDAAATRARYNMVIQSIKDCVELDENKELVISGYLELPILLEANGIPSVEFYKRLGLNE